MTKAKPINRTFAQQIQALFRGQVLWAFVQWGILAFLARYSDEKSGQYTLALSISAPIYLFFDLNLRVVRSTDHSHDESYVTYFGLRVWTLVLATLLFLGLGRWLYPDLFWLFVAMATFRLGESISNLAYGQWQRTFQSHLIGKSMTQKGLIGLALAGLVIWLTSGSTVATALVMGANSLLTAIWFDLPRSWGTDASKVTFSFSNALASLHDWKSFRRIATRAWPLGFDALLSSLALNVPRYFVEGYHGRSLLGVYGVLSQLAFSIQMLLGAVGHAGVSVLTERFQLEDRRSFWRLLNRMVLSSMSVGLVAVVTGTLLIPFLMSRMIASEYDNVTLMFWLLVSSCLAGVQRTAGRATQACGSYFLYTLFDVVILLGSLVGSWLLIPQYSVAGAAMALSLGFLIGTLVTLGHTYWVLPNSPVKTPTRR